MPGSRLIIFLIFVASSMALSFWLYLLSPTNSEAFYQDFFIEKDTGFRQIAGNLKAKGLIRSVVMFKWYGLLTGSAAKLKAGNYWLSPSQSTPEILNKLVAGPDRDALVTVIEGETLKEIDDKLSEKGIIRKDSLRNFDWAVLKDDYPFLAEAKSLEGFLFPDTYRFYRESSTETVARKLLDNFQMKAMPLLRDSKRGYKSLILASIIEKEVPFSNDRRLVSGLLQKRLRIGMPLQVDAAPDTYKYYGLPPQPIANPGADAILAALNPIISDYLYYLSDPKTKKTIFSRTLDEHNDNRVIYLKR